MRKLIDTIRDAKNKVMAKAVTAVNTAREAVADYHNGIPGHADEDRTGASAFNGHHKHGKYSVGNRLYACSNINAENTPRIFRTHRRRWKYH